MAFYLNMPAPARSADPTHFLLLRNLYDRLDRQPNPDPQLVGCIALTERHRPGRCLTVDLRPELNLTWTSFIPMDAVAVLAFGDPVRAHGDLALARRFVAIHLQRQDLTRAQRCGGSAQHVHPQPPRNLRP